MPREVSYRVFSNGEVAVTVDKKNWKRAFGQNTLMYFLNRAENIYTFEPTTNTRMFIFK